MEKSPEQMKINDALDLFEELKAKINESLESAKAARQADRKEAMIAQAKILSSWAPNIVVKIPATNAGITAYEECAALGMNVAATVSFTVPQVLAVAEAAERGKKRAIANGIKPGLTIAVLMVGRLDDYLRDVAQDCKAAVGESDIIQAGIACIMDAVEIAEKVLGL